MTELTTNLQDTIDNTLQTVLGKNTSSPRTSILLWTNNNPQNSFILKKEGKKYLGLPRTDRRGETYWSFREIRNKSNQSKISPEFSPATDNITKFQQRQNQAENYDKPNKSKPATVNQQSH